MTKKAVVIGATGLVGRALVERLGREPSVELIATITRRPAAFLTPKVAQTVVDFSRLRDVAALFSADFLFSCLGTTRAQAGSVEAQRVVDFDYQLTAARLAAEAGVPHYLLVSSAGADAASRSPYLRMKGELEQAVLALPFRRISIFRPSVLVGDRREARPAERLAARLLSLVGALPGLRRYRPIRGEQVAETMVRAALTDGPARRILALDEVFPA